MIIFIILITDINKKNIRYSNMVLKKSDLNPQKKNKKKSPFL